MNRLKTTDIGGFPLRLDDFRWLNDAQLETFKGTIKSLIGDANYCILYGCLIADTKQNNIWTCSEGFVYFADEIFYVPAHQVTFSSDYLFFAPDVSYQSPEGLKTFQDANTHETYEYRRAKLNSAASYPQIYMPYDAQNMIAILRNRLAITDPPVETGWTEVILDSSNVQPATGGAISNISGNMTYKLRGKTAFVSIDLIFTVDTATQSVYISLPSAFTIKTEPVIDVNLIHNIIGSSEIERDDYIYRLMTFGPTSIGTQLRIAHLNNGIDLIANSYHMMGQIYFEIN